MNKCLRPATNIVRHYGTKISPQQIAGLVKQTVDNCRTLGIITNKLQSTYFADNLIKTINNTMMKSEEDLLIENTRAIYKKNTIQH